MLHVLVRANVHWYKVCVTCSSVSSVLRACSIWFETNKRRGKWLISVSCRCALCLLFGRRCIRFLRVCILPECCALLHKRNRLRGLVKVVCIVVCCLSI